MTPPGGDEGYSEGEVTLGTLSTKLDNITEKVEPVARLCTVIAVFDIQMNGKMGVLEQLKEHEDRLTALEKVLNDFKTIKAIAIYMAIVFTGCVSGLLWEIMTHRITLVH
jgi:hypothetical protein